MKMKTQCKIQAHLVAALQASGIKFEQAQAGQTLTMNGYGGVKRQADFVIRKSEIASYGDMGYKWNGSEFDLVADDYAGQRKQEQVIKLISREYAAAFTIAQMEAAGYGWERVDQENGAIQLVVSGRL